jgi:hypothetical protein
MATDYEEQRKKYQDLLQKVWQDHGAQEGILSIRCGPFVGGVDEIKPSSIVVYLDGTDASRKLTIPNQIDGIPTKQVIAKLTISREEGLNPGQPNRASALDCLLHYVGLNWKAVDSAHQKSLEASGKRIDVQTSFGNNVFVLHDPDQSLLVQSGDNVLLNLMAAHRLFRAGGFEDNYDFLAFFIDVDSGILPDKKTMGNASTIIFSDVHGIGLAPLDQRGDWGSNRLRLVSHFSEITMRTLLHETGHLWCSYAMYRDPNTGTIGDLLHQDFDEAHADQIGFHWGRFVDDANTCMDYDRCDWIDNGDDTFNRMRNTLDEFTQLGERRFGYSSLDLYLMGLIDENDVPRWKVIPVTNPRRIDDDFPGPYRPDPPGPLTMTVQEIANLNGKRDPDPSKSPRIFHQASIIITKTTDPNSPFISDVADRLIQHESNFRRATGGGAIVDCRLLRAGFDKLYLKGTPEDTGVRSETGDFSSSPDIWVRNNADGDAHFDSQAPNPDQDNWIYARIRNRGAQPYENVVVNFYLFQSASEPEYPTDWSPARRINTARIATVPASSRDNDGSVIAKVRWSSDQIPARLDGNTSILCEIFPTQLEPSSLHGLGQNSKIAQRRLLAR